MSAYELRFIGRKPLTRLRLLSGPQHSTLSASLEGTYRDQHVLGHGFDVIRSEVLGHALEPFMTEANKTKESFTNVRSVTNDAEMQQELDISVSADFDIDGIDIGVSADYINRIRASAHSLSIIAQYSSNYSGYSLAAPGTYQLNSTATNYLDSYGVDEFVKKYGQYFLAGHLYGSSFYAVYNCYASDTERFDDFKSSLAVNVPDLFDIDGSVDFTREAKSYGVEIEISIYMVGYDSSVPLPVLDNLKPENVINALNWFRANELGVPIGTLFMSFSNIIPTFSNTIEVGSDLLTRLRLTYGNYWLIKYLHRSAPEYYRKQNKSTYDTFITEMEVRNNEFMKDGTLVDEFYHRSGQMIRYYDAIQDREKLYFKIQTYTRTSPEPDKGDKMYQSRVNTDSFGVVNFGEIEGQHITKTQEYIFKDWEFLASVDASFHWEDSERIILGWRVSSDKDSNGYWEKRSSGEAVFSSRLALYFESEGTRALSYTVEVWSIDKSLFKFGNLAIAADGGDDEIH